mmetsp:Transcript_5960/g.15610  ORF Transcript_5960/g.15610 Transcript_5960/m.15610 type:complete len:211 (+) Transcript_5960:273-905(+)
MLRRGCCCSTTYAERSASASASAMAASRPSEVLSDCAGTPSPPPSPSSPLPLSASSPAPPPPFTASATWLSRSVSGPGARSSLPYSAWRVVTARRKEETHPPTLSPCSGSVGCDHRHTSAALSRGLGRRSGRGMARRRGSQHSSCTTTPSGASSSTVAAAACCTSSPTRCGTSPFCSGSPPSTPWMVARGKVAAHTKAASVRHPFKVGEV